MHVHEVMQGVPAMGHTSRGYWHPGRADGCPKCQPSEQWWVVVERESLEGHALVPIVVGPYATEQLAARAGNSDGGHVDSLLTVDAKNDGYVATECYWTTNRPARCEVIR